MTNLLKPNPVSLNTNAVVDCGAKTNPVSEVSKHAELLCQDLRIRRFLNSPCARNELLQLLSQHILAATAAKDQRVKELETAIKTVRDRMAYLFDKDDESEQIDRAETRECVDDYLKILSTALLKEGKS